MRAHEHSHPKCSQRHSCQLIGGGTQSGGTDEHARAKWAGQFETRGYLVEYAHFARSAAVSIIANSMVGHPLESLPVPLTQNIMYIYVYYYTANRRLCMGIPPYRSVRYQNCVGALPPQVKYCGGACPPCPPGSAAYATSYSEFPDSWHAQRAREFFLPRPLINIPHPLIRRTFSAKQCLRTIFVCIMSVKTRHGGTAVAV